MVKRLLFSIVGIIGIVQSSIAQSDTIKVHDLQEVEVRASAPSASFLATAPQQAFSSDKLEKINALQVSDAMKYFSGVQVKDYGGVGGLKTVSIRSLGANYTAVAYDGMTVSDYQTGQIDLGRFSLDNVAQVRLNTGGSDDIFQPARNQALSGLIQIVSQSFIPTETKRSEWKAGVKTGSWQLFNPFLSHSRALNDVFTLRCSGEYLSSKGDYPYRLDNEERRRNHSEVTNQRWEAHLTGKFGKNKTLTFKSVYFDSDRNLPGSAISGNTYAGERMKDRNIFSQINYTQYLTNRWSFQANARFDYTAMQYSHLLYPEIGSRYYQREAYLSATVLYKSSEHLSFSWANDGSYGDFKAIHKDKSLFPSRCLWLSALSGKYETPVLTLNASLLSQLEQRQHVSPYLGISLQPLNSLPVRLRAYYKNTYRLPTFADIYYPTFPNTGLKPENAHQFNAGMTFATACGERVSYLSVSADAYYNKVQNKIVAIPIGSLALWSVRNYGEVSIQGLDLSGTIHVRMPARCTLEISGNYTLQDVLNENRQRLRYTPRHFFTAFAFFKTPWCDLNYTLVYCGNRYYNETPAWDYLVRRYADQGFSINKMWQRKHYRLHLSAECLNLADLHYEVVHAYPMPGRSFRLGVKIIY